VNASDDDAQRALERHALRNVHSLARRLGYGDAIDRHGERFVLVSLAVVIVLVVGAVAIVLARPDPSRSDSVINRQRCELEAGIVVVDEMRADLKARQPHLTKADLERRVTVMHTDVKQEAARRCAERGL
jgi:hypothetical protein